MCFLSPSGSSGDVTQNTYYNRNRPWDPTDVKPMGPSGDFTTAGADKLAIPDSDRAGGSTPTGVRQPKRSSLTTGGSA